MVVMVAITRSPFGTKSRAHSFDRLPEKHADEDKRKSENWKNNQHPHENPR